MLQNWKLCLVKDKQRILCNYVNSTEYTQVVRVSDIASWYERVVFPGEEILFEALPEASLEIHSDEMPCTILADDIPCSRLAIGLVSHVVQHLRSTKLSPEIKSK